MTGTALLTTAALTGWLTIPPTLGRWRSRRLRDQAIRDLHTAQRAGSLTNAECTRITRMLAEAGHP